MIGLSGSQMKEIDLEAISQGFITGESLMYQAGSSVIDVIKGDFTELSTKILVLCGPGNNGGDGFVIGCGLKILGYDVKVCFLGQIQSLSQDAHTYYKQLLEMENKTEKILFSSKDTANFISETDLIVDAIFGFSLNRPIEAPYDQVIESINGSEAAVYSVDLPSGIHSENGQIMGICVKADKTITFTLPKIGMILFPGALYTGEVILKSIGIPSSLIENRDFEYEIIDDSFVHLMPRRHKISHKGTYGKVVIIAGSKTMAGAAILTGKAAYRTGAGLVHVITEAGNEVGLFSALPEAIVTTYTKDLNFDNQLESIKDILRNSDGILIGSGLTTDSYAKALVDYVLTLQGKKIVMDADALNIISENPNLLKEHGLDLVVTPHIGEMGRLTGYSHATILDNPIEFAKAFSNLYQVVTVLKSARTVITLKDKVFVNVLGHSGMATAGSGDVLAGIIIGLIGQGCSTALAAVLGTYIHSKSAHEMLSQVNAYSMMASDLIEGINKVLRQSGTA